MWIKGSVVQEWVDSKLLIGNPAGVPHRRPLVAYIPDHVKGDRFPVVYCLAPWTNAGRNLLEWRPFKESLPERVERLVENGAMGPVVVVCPDLYTDFGGTQFIDSAFFGPHAKHLVEEVFEFAERELPVKPGPAHRAVFGRSSGAYGALRLAMDYPASVAAVACHSADLGFETMFRGELINIVKGLASYRGSVESFLSAVRKSPKLSGQEVHLLMLLGCCGFYSPNLASAVGFDLPIDLYSGEISEDIWQKWLCHDPVVRVDQCAESIRKLKLLYIECGLRDQYNLLYGARQLKRKLELHKIRHLYEEFDDNHSSTDYRYDISLPLIYEAIS